MMHAGSLRCGVVFVSSTRGGRGGVGGCGLDVVVAGA